jgi:gamma-glutamyltranspeptidase/glutathione hydrolase
MTAGVAALVKQKNPSWTPSMIRAAIMNNASNLRKADGTPVADGTQNVNQQGAGHVDAFAAANTLALMGVGHIDRSPGSPTERSHGVFVQTGLWLNNCLGELELNRRGLNATPAGARLPSNMTPAVARRSRSVLAIGSPGADRITTALHQFMVHFIQRGLTLSEAIAHPRLHLEFGQAGMKVAFEPGLEPGDCDLPVTLYPEISMYFGGVAAALFDGECGFDVAADPRREGATFVSPEHKRG